MTTFAAAERARLADLLLEKGPHAPTLCGGWSTRDLAAHLWLRESRPDAFAALFIPPLSRHLDRLTADTKRRDYAEVVREWAAGPSALNPMRAADKHVKIEKAATIKALERAAHKVERASRQGATSRRHPAPGVAGPTTTYSPN